MIGINVPIPVPMASTDSAVGRRHHSATATPTAPRARTSPTRGKAITSRWLDPRHGGIELGFPTNKRPLPSLAS